MLAVSLRFDEMDDSIVTRMILSGIPIDEPFLQHRLSFMVNEERKGLRVGKLPVNDCFYLMGTADPTGTLKSDEVCIILCVIIFLCYLFCFIVTLGHLGKEKDKSRLLNDYNFVENPFSNSYILSNHFFF